MWTDSYNVKVRGMDTYIHTEKGEELLIRTTGKITEFYKVNREFGEERLVFMFSVRAKDLRHAQWLSIVARQKHMNYVQLLDLDH